MTVLVVNCGSSSVKYQLVDLDDNRCLTKGLIELSKETVPDHKTALQHVAGQVTDVLASSATSLQAIGHRVVHGGSSFVAPTLITDEVIATITELSTLAPLHNPANVRGIEATRYSFPDVPQVAVFDTAFHATIPPAHSRYAIPQVWAERHQVRRYGFHGTSHSYVSAVCMNWLQTTRAVDQADSRIVVLHLGNGASACAVAGGRSVDTTMGFTPLPGLVMGTRSGDVDPAVFSHLSRVAGLSVEEVESSLNKQSGLLGLCGDSDMRAVLSRAASGDEAAELALDVYVHRIRSVVGAYWATLGGLDALVFTAGVGENSPAIRQRIVASLSGIGIEISAQKNAEPAIDAMGVGLLSDKPDGVAVMVIATNEEQEIAKQTLAVLAE